ncbi:MAG: AarF/ABC1/UbiB kinase family protein [Myxococcales bacterium]|nr:AarF/ABC1/UbiB kinase family protein [Myxococcales bacterium]
MAQSLAIPAAVATAALSTTHALPRPRPSQVLWRLLVVQAVAWFFAAVWLLDLVGLRWLWYLARGQRESYERVTLPVALRLAFERLGPTYVKLGQLVASGEALFPPRYSNEFQKCLDRVPPFPFTEVRATLEHELGKGVDRFQAIDSEPMAAASIAQVHAATLADGREVVIKVQRPRLLELVSTDVVLMRLIARLSARVSARARQSHPEGIVEDFAQNLAEELDFRNEARRMTEFNQVMRLMGTDSVAAPEVVRELSGRHVLTMERFRGVSVADTAAVKHSGFDGEERLRTGIRAWFQCLLVADFFHGDVHGGNFMLLDDGRIGFLDFGIVGTLPVERQAGVLEYVLAFQSRDFGRLGDAMIAIGAARAQVDRTAFTRDLEELYSPMFDPSEAFRIADLVPNLMRLANRHQLGLPRDLVLISKQLVYLDRYSRALGGDKMNVLTDSRIRELLMEDMLRAAFARQERG